MDAPALPAGVTTLLQDTETIVVMDVGGDARGARGVGQFRQFCSQEDTEHYFVLNCYRPFSQTADLVEKTYSLIQQAARLDEMKVICNPNYGEKTKPEDIYNGVIITENLIGKIHAVALSEALKDCVYPKWKYPTIYIDSFIRYP